MNDPGTERALLGCIAKFGRDAYIECCEIINSDCFTLDENIHLFNILKKCIDDHTEIDLSSILSTAHDLGLATILSQDKPLDHIKAILQFPATINNTRGYAQKLRRLEITRTVSRTLEDIKGDLSKVTGSESLDSILASVEDPIFNFSSNLRQYENNGPIPLFENIDEYIQYLEENPVGQIGLNTGFPRFDAAIGGGLRRKSVSVIGARMKNGKSMLADNIAINLCKQEIPVLMLDTEMGQEDHLNRILANISGIETESIETGKFGKRLDYKDRVREAAKILKQYPYDYISVAGKPFEEIASIIRRWIFKTVGFAEGRTSNCLVIYDYLKLMNADNMKNMQEYQVIGFQMTQLHNLAVEYDIPILSFVQLNRDGISKEDTSTVAQSDRILWLCTNFSILKRKTDDEIAEDGPTNGNTKLIPLVARHGPGISDNNWINLRVDVDRARMAELTTRIEAKNDANGFTAG